MEEKIKQNHQPTSTPNLGTRQRTKITKKKANIEIYGKNVKFQSLRKILYEYLASMDKIVACVITAKKIDTRKITYRTSMDSECERI